MLISPIKTVLERSHMILKATISTCTQLQKDWKILGLNHVAIATTELDKVASFYKNVLKAKTSNIISLPEHGVDAVFIDVGNTKFELLRSHGKDSPIQGFLEKNKLGGMHHVCIEVDNIKNAIDDLNKYKIRLLNEVPKLGAHGKPVVFLHPKDCGGVLIELEEA